MSALTMILTAAMMVPASGPERVSDEVEQRLDLRGEWWGSVCTDDGRFLPTEFFTVGDNRYGLIFGAHRKSLESVILGEIVDEGNGWLEARLGKGIRLGIYKQDAAKLTICFARPGDRRPQVFQGGGGRTLLILRRVKPRK